MSNPAPYATIIGVAEHVRSGDLREDGLPQIYWSYNARPSSNMSYVLQSAGPPQQLAAAAQRALTTIDATVPLTNVAPMTQYVRAATAQARFTLILMEVVGGLAVFLAAVGLYSVIAFVVAQRTREFGIRLALGETPGGLRASVVKRGLWLVVGSASAGVAAALMAVQTIETMLFQVNPYDPVIFSSVVVFLLAVGAAACYVPARRASRADPLVALRSE
jgi:putative ABC transport system permease protein